MNSAPVKPPPEDAHEAALVRQMTQRLVQEHRSLEAQWKALEPVVRAASQGKPAALDMALHLRHAVPSIPSYI